MPGQRSYATGGYALELDGKNVGQLKSVEGGDAFADVVAQASAKSYYAKKNVTTVKYSPVKLRVGVSMGKAFYDWIAAGWTGDVQRRGGSIVEADDKGAVKARREFADALISEVAFPAFDGASKEAGYLTVTLAPEHVAAKKGVGKSAAPFVKQKLWATSNFKLELDGLDTARVSKIDAFTIRQTVAESATGARRVRAKEPAKVEFPNLRVTLASTGAQTWIDWFDDFVLKGNSGDANEKGGTLRLLSANLKDELGQVRLFNVGIFKLAADPTEAAAIKRVVADLYCERMELGIPG
jgi:phage tail-like protein